MQFHAIESAFRAVPGHRGVAGHDLGDLVPLHGLGHLAEHRVRHWAGRPHGQPGEHRRGLAAVVVQLGEDRHVVRVHRCGHLPIAGDDRPVEAVDQLLVGPVGGMSRVLLGDDQPRRRPPREPRSSRRAAGSAGRPRRSWSGARRTRSGCGPPPGRSAAARTGTGTGCPRSSAASGLGQDLAAQAAGQLASRADRQRNPAALQHRLEHGPGGHAVASPRGAAAGAGTASAPAADARNAPRTRSPPCAARRSTGPPAAHGRRPRIEAGCAARVPRPPAAAASSPRRGHQ